MARGTFAASEIAEFGTAAGLEPERTLHAVRRYGRIGWIATAHRVPGARGGGALHHDIEQAAIGLILAAIAQRTDIDDARRLTRLAEYLNEDSGGGVPYVRRVLADIEDDGGPCLGVAVFAMRVGPPTTVFAVRLDAERGVPVQPPPGAVSWLAGCLELGPLLLPLLAAAHAEREAAH